MKDTDLTLEQAQHAYGRSLVPWILDDRDLRIINKTRQEAVTQTGNCMKIPDGGATFSRLIDINEVLHKRLWHAATLEAHGEAL